MLLLYTLFQTNKMQNTDNLKQSLRLSHLAFWKPSTHLIQFPKKGSHTLLL